MILSKISRIADAAEGPLEVHLTNSGPTLVEILGPVSIVIAALGGAWFAARYARDNTKQELAAAEQRIDRQATRTTIDEVVGTMTEVLDAAADFAVAVGNGEALQREINEAPEASPKRGAAETRYKNYAGGELEKFMTGAFEAYMRIPPTKLRLRLRFTPDHPVLATFDRWHSVMNLSQERVGRGIGRTRTRQELQESEEIEAEIPVSLEAFVTAVRSWVDRYEAK